jgi:glycosyltransferase involved in cell wall biosynthesis
MKVFDMLAHEGYHYELCKLQCDFVMIVDKLHRWNERYRPLPNNVTCFDKSMLSVHHVERHDVAIIHNYKQFQLLRECVIPKIIIFHCSKQGQGDAEFCNEDLSEYILVFNSYTDKERWNLKCPKQYVIWHGFDPNEWPVSDREINKALTVGRRISERDSICGYRIIQGLERSGIPIKLVGDNPALDIQSPESFTDLRRYYSKHAVYLNPTMRSPMPRARGEAMMSGIPIVTTGFYDEEMFIEHGINGFVSNNINEIKEYTALLLADKDLQATMAQNVRRTALERFHISRFLNDWKKILSEATHQDISSITVLKPGAPKVYVTRKDSSAGGGTVSSENMISGLREHGYAVKCLDINSKGWVSFVDGKKMPSGSARLWENFIQSNPCDTIIFDDVERYHICKSNLDPNCKIILCILGNPQVHPQCWYESGVLDINEPDNPVEAILCRPIYAQYLKTLFGKDKIYSWYGGCDGEGMRERHGIAQYKHPRDGALIISAHRGTDWWKNPATATLAAYGIYNKYPETIYFKPSSNEYETQLLKNIKFDIQYGGTPKEGMEQDVLLSTMACAQLALEPGYSEGFSRSCNELMNLGVPVIQGPNAQHIYENEFLTEHLIVRDPSDIQEVVDKALVLLEDKKLWKEVSAESMRFSARFNIKQEVDTLIKALERK